MDTGTVGVSGVWIVHGRTYTVAPQELLLPLVTGKVLPGMEGELALGLGLILRRKILLKLSMQVLSQLIVLAGMHRDLLHKPLR